ncbi:hypothetical protein V499_00678 [Pseudogymnoascus sp. VKM F-103]|nr:hypothetical protein V499_00678 [Pseudogymnoascus sp. VKM F-103]
MFSKIKTSQQGLSKKTTTKQRQQEAKLYEREHKITNTIPNGVGVTPLGTHASIIAIRLVAMACLSGTESALTAGGLGTDV